jgi:hypothetical protein
MEPNQKDPDRQQVAWINQEVARYAHQGLVPGAAAEAEAVRNWRHNRYKMYQRLQSLGILEKTAFVLSQKCQEAMNRYVIAGMPPTDAREQAVAEWMMLGPEEAPDR